MKTKLEYRLRADGKYDFHLIAANGEALMNGSQGYDKKNLKRAAASLRKAMDAAELCGVVQPLDSPDDPGGDAGGPGTPPIKP